MPPPLLLLSFNVCLFLAVISLVSSQNDRLAPSSSNHPILQLSVFPNAGPTTDNIDIRCEITQPSSILPIASSKPDNVYVSVKTDNVKPSGILIMFEDSIDRCHTKNGRNIIQVPICNASLILIRVNHTILNDSVRTIDYACSKGDQIAYGSFYITRDQSARYYEPKDNSSSSLSSSWTYVLLLLSFIVLNSKLTIANTEEVRWSSNN